MKVTIPNARFLRVQALAVALRDQMLNEGGDLYNPVALERAARRMLGGRPEPTLLREVMQEVHDLDQIERRRRQILAAISGGRQALE